MDDIEGTDLVCFEIISSVGAARSSFIEAIDLAAEGDVEAAKAKVTEGAGFFSAGHAKHAELIQQEASGDHVPAGLLLIHAEDQLMSAETFQILAEKFIALAEHAA
ncbi:MAG: PTS lactose/cellobiose transporter subunit IIA [Atopobiaceae bacterium]|jgi:PTS system cellobiose-specific IIA component|nr:PTS lactose/cellobiose transporter subunit IIA [Atopobiaceae bacterium]MCH4181521.1 PTS lactose/cellobiose transporter subunit IIA [Atopobiaceae bacterium]MCH4214660.1 PTS lactose/cellobiose transporter subunit IIA [Atopobiaceae bacterium]MCI1225891.1 PTS lactose/cellobiose transporter subunit IIA [Atopobiaceae bacterium]MCI1260468.1 PTS lactose/cellobiose transporter subunit IIA [Atopobiaceae bacterium]